MNTPLNFQEYSMPISLFDYYIKYSKTSVFGTVKKYTFGLPGVLIKAIKGKSKELILPGNSVNQPILLTEDQYDVKEAIDELILRMLMPRKVI